LQGLDVLEIGPGQFLAHMKCFAIRNRVVGIDSDVIVQGLNPMGYFRMLRINGTRRTIKTVGRKLMGVDRRYAAELSRQLKSRKEPRLKVYQMDAGNLSFSDQSFDFVYARSVLQHLPSPGDAIDEMVRILKPGGAVYLSLHLYSSPNGCLDPRRFTERRNEIEGWPHLRPHLDHTVRSNAWLNRLRLEEWKTLFSARMPEVEFILNGPNDPSLESQARTLQQQGELSDYTLEELLTSELLALWKKPLKPHHCTSVKN